MITDLDRLRRVVARTRAAFVTPDALAHRSRLDLDRARTAVAALVEARELAPVAGGRWYVVAMRR